MKNKSRIKDQTREAFLSAFYQLAQKKRISQITIRELTNLAGYNRTTFYRYFEDIYELVEYAETDFLKSIQTEVEKRCSEHQFEERLFFETIIQCFHENKEHVTILLSEENRSHFLRRISESINQNPSFAIKETPKKKTIRDIYYYGIFHAISINPQNKDALPDEDLLNIIQTLFDNWYKPEMKKND